MYLQTWAGLGQSQPICEAAIEDLDRLSASLKSFNKELKKTYVDPKRLKNLGSLVTFDVDRLIGNLDTYMDDGCCRAELKTLEAQVRALPWTFQRTRGKKIVVVERFSDISRAFRKVIKAIQDAQWKASSLDRCSTN